MTKKTGLGVFVIAMAAIMNGCLGYPLSERSYDVTRDPAWWGQMHLNEILVLNQDMLLAGNGLTPGSNPTVEMYKANPEKYSPQIRLIVKGTRLRCVSLERYWTSEYGVYHVGAEILDGDSKGKIIEVPGVTGNPRAKGTLRLNTFFVYPTSSQ